MSLRDKVLKMDGPILVLGASGFIGSNIYRSLCDHRDDVYGTASSFPFWRIEGSLVKHMITCDLSLSHNLSMVLDNVAPKTIINCLSHGAYPFQKDELNIFEMNFGVIPTLMSYCEYARAKLIHAGTSSEYGSNSAGPKENYVGIVDDMYAITKQNATKYIRFAGKNVYSCSLRLYSVYGPWEDSSRLIPQIIQFGLRQEIPPLAFPSISRDFIYVEDVVEAFVHASIYLEEKDYGGVFNIGTGLKTTLAEIGLLAYDKFRSASRPVYNSMPPRDWDHCNDWYADPAKAGERLNWKFKTPLAAGIDKTVEWYRLRLSNGKNWPSLRDCNSPKERGVI